MSKRVWFARRAVSLQGLHPELPIDGQPTRKLSAAGDVSFSVIQELAATLAEDDRPMFDKWGTLIFMEEGKQLRWGGIVIDRSEEGSKIDIECGSFMSYFFGQAWTGDISFVNADPVTVIRAIIDHVQSFPDGDLGIEVVGSTSVRIGTELREKQERDPVTGQFIPKVEGAPVEYEPVPYTFSWWDNGDCGQEIQRIVDECAIEWVEEHEWIDRDAGTMRHILRIGDRVGGRREDLTFEQGVNVNVIPSFEDDGDEYASEIHALGAGEGKQSLRYVKAVRVPNRLRRARILDETKDIQTQSRLDAVADMALRMLSGALTTEEITVTEHEHAPIGSWNIGDEILVTLRDSAGKPISRWYRIEADEIVSNVEAVLSLQPIYA